MTLPAMTPESSRTPGPDGTRSDVIVPGDGRNFTGSSA